MPAAPGGVSGSPCLTLHKVTAPAWVLYFSSGRGGWCRQGLGSAVTEALGRPPQPRLEAQPMQVGLWRGGLNALRQGVAGHLQWV